MSWEEDLVKMASMTAALNAQAQRLVVLVEQAPPQLLEALKTVQMPDFDKASEDFKEQAMALLTLARAIESGVPSPSSSSDRPQS